MCTVILHNIHYQNDFLLLYNYRELLSGVDTLKNIAEVLRFIDRISEVKQR